MQTLPILPTLTAEEWDQLRAKTRGQLEELEGLRAIVLDATPEQLDELVTSWAQTET